MSKPILVGYDPESGDRSPVDFAAAAGRLTGAPLVVAVVHVGDELQPAMVVLGSARRHGVLASATNSAPQTSSPAGRTSWPKT